MLILRGTTRIPERYLVARRLSWLRSQPCPGNGGRIRLAYLLLLSA